MLVFFDAYLIDGKLFYRNKTVSSSSLDEFSLYQDSDLFSKMGVSTESHYLIGELFPQSTYFVLDQKTRVLIENELEKYNREDKMGQHYYDFKMKQENFHKIIDLIQEGTFRYLIFDRGYYLGHNLVKIFSRKDFNFWP